MLESPLIDAYDENHLNAGNHKNAGILRRFYWDSRESACHIATLLKFDNRSFRDHVAKEIFDYVVGGRHPVTDETEERMNAAVDWILRAQKATPDDGFSYGYFPCARPERWRPSYPETTGYIISSLVEFAKRYGTNDVLLRALRAARWEVSIQMESGAVQGGPVCLPQQQTPAIFNTGMVLEGWSATYRITGDRFYLNAGRRAADFLLSDLSPDSYFRTNGKFVGPDVIKTYNCLCAWALFLHGEDSQHERYKLVAIRIIEAALRQQKANGWFANNCLTNPSAPLLHTICYTLQGVLEVGVLANRNDFVSAVERGTKPIIEQLAPNGFLYGRFYSDWKPACLSSCLTGSAQLAVVCYRLYEILRKPEYKVAADRIVNFLKTLQSLRSVDYCLNGALAGSFPLLGQYMTLGYPNWATKYFLDSLMLQARLNNPKAPG